MAHTFVLQILISTLYNLSSRIHVNWSATSMPILFFSGYLLQERLVQETCKYRTTQNS